MATVASEPQENNDISAGRAVEAVKLALTAETSGWARPYAMASATRTQFGGPVDGGGTLPSRNEWYTHPKRVFILLYMDKLDVNLLEEALVNLGSALELEGLDVGLVAIGGSALLLLKFIERPTRNIDVVAVVDDDGRYVSADPLPPEVVRCKDEVADFLGLDRHWLNGGPTLLLNQGLPEGFDRRVCVRRYGGLTLYIASRLDLIYLKFSAAVDNGPDSKHVHDLKALEPTREELIGAARWSRTHDPSDGFRAMAMQALHFFGVTDVEVI